MYSAHMTPRERVFAALQGKAYDCLPAINPTSVANTECMRVSGAFLPKAHTDAYDMANLAATGHKVLGFDSVMPYFSLHLEASALGCEVDWGNGTRMPTIIKKPFDRMDQYVRPTAFLQSAECRQLLRAIRLLKKRFGDHVAIIGKVVGPWSLAYNLYGVENLLLDAILEPERTGRFIQELLDIPIQFALAQFKAGADIITWAEHVTSDLVSAQMYKELIFPLHRIAAEQLTPHGYVILHTCGNVMDRLDTIRKTGFQVFHIDSRNDLRLAMEIAGGDILLAGSINNPVTLARGTRLDVRREVEENIRAKIHLISPECAIPFTVSNRNLIELVYAAHRARPQESLA